MTAVAGSARVTIRLWVVFSLLMALCATASGLFLLHLARPFITALGAPLAGHATMLLFMGAASAGVMAAVGGLIVGLRFAGRSRAIVHKAEALTPLWTEPASPRGSDELGALDAALGRLTLSVDRFVRDSDILARLPEGMLLVAPDGGLLSFNAAAETVLGVPLARYRSTAILAADGPLPVHRGNERLARLLEEAMTARDPQALFLDLHLGRQLAAQVAPELYQIRVEFELAVGVILLAARVCLATGRSRHGTILGYLGLLFAIITVDPLVFYFEQFSTITTTAVQFALVLLLLYYRSRFVKSLSFTPTYLEGIIQQMGFAPIGEDPRRSRTGAYKRVQFFLEKKIDTSRGLISGGVILKKPCKGIDPAGSGRARVTSPGCGSGAIVRLRACR